MRSYNVISADSHVNSPTDIYAGRMPAHLADRAPRVEESGEGSFWVYEGKKRPAIGLGHMAGRKFEDYKTSDGSVKFEDVRAGGFFAEERVKDMDIDGMDAEVLYSGFVGADIQDPELRQECMRAYNDWLMDYCNVAPDRLAGLSVLPSWDKSLMMNEMRRAAKIGMKGCQIPAYAPFGGSYGDKPYADYWSAVEELGWPASIHLGGRTSSGLADNPLPFIASTTIALAEPFAIIIYGGVLERHPGLKLICTEAGIGWWAYFLERMDNVYHRHRWWTKSDLPQPPSFYFHRNCYSTFQEDIAGVRVWDLIGSDNIMWASDYPHTDATWPESQKVIEEHFAGVPENDKRKMVCTNAQGLYFQG